MGRNSSGLHLKIAEWILERGEAICVYDVTEKFGITLRQATGHLSILGRDNAIKMQKIGSVPMGAPYSHYRRTLRTVTITGIDREKIEQRTKNPDYGNYKNHPVRSVGDLPLAEKWEWITRNAWRHKK